MISSDLRTEVEKQAMKHQPPLRHVSADDVGTQESLKVKGRTRPADAVILTNGSDLVPEPVSWLWSGWLAQGKLHILGGAPGQGKTTIAIAFAATVTSGGRFPDGSRCDPGNVLIWSGEDDPADTLLPRLMVAGGDRRRCYFVSGTRSNGAVRSFDPSKDMDALETQAKLIGGIKLLVVDPVVSAVTGDSHKNTEVRRALQPIVDLTSRLDCVAIGITHFSKGGAGTDPAQRLSGSVAFSAVARVVMVAAKVSGEEGSDRRILARAKSNIGPDDGGYEYHIEQAEPIPGISASFISWGQAISGSARELLAEPEGRDGGSKKSAVESAADFLCQVLASGSTPVNTIKDEAMKAGVSWASVKRATEERVSVIKTKSADAWYWKLPDMLHQEAQGAQPLKLEHLEHLEHLHKDAIHPDTQSEFQEAQEAQGAQHFGVERVEHVDLPAYDNQPDLQHDAEEF